MATATDSLELIRSAGIHAAAKDPDTAHLVIGLNKVISSRLVPGLEVEPEENEEGVNIHIRVADGARIAKPVHMCFGLLQEAGIQRIGIDLTVEDDAKIGIVAHCIFPSAEQQPGGEPPVKHLMDATIRIGAGSEYTYFERHVHSSKGGVLVAPKARVELADHARFKTDFELVEGRVGKIDIDYETVCGPYSVMEMTAKISARADDVVKIRETGLLSGEHSRGVLTSRVAVRDQARADVYNKLTATAAYARGHVDCQEIIAGGGIANAVPIVEVSHPKAHITHEATLGSVDNKQLETLMARGLDEDAASDLIISGLLA